MLPRLVLALVLVLCSAVAALAASSVWQARKGGTVLYVGGSFHLLRPADYPLPPEFDRAFKAADIVVFETDIAALNDPATQLSLLANGSYQDGSTIADHLSPAVYRKLADFCAANGYPLPMLGQLKPALLMMTLTVLELKKLGVESSGVDQFIHDQAVREKKRVVGLETVAEQLGYLVSIADGIEDQFVLQALQDLQTIEDKFAGLVAAWRRGDSAALEKFLVEEVKAEQPQLYRRLIVDRNRNWLKAIDGYDRQPGVRFILVGAAHLIGPDGLLAALKKKGYKIVQL